MVKNCGNTAWNKNLRKWGFHLQRPLLRFVPVHARSPQRAGAARAVVPGLEGLLLRVEKAQTTGDKSALCPQCDQRRAGPWARCFVSERMITSHLLSHLLWVVVTVDVSGWGAHVPLLWTDVALRGQPGLGRAGVSAPFMMEFSFLPPRP